MHFSPLSFYAFVGKNRAVWAGTGKRVESSGRRGMESWNWFRSRVDVYALGTLVRIHHRSYEMVERGGRVAAAAGVDGRGLNNRATRSNKPVKTLALR